MVGEEVAQTRPRAGRPWTITSDLVEVADLRKQPDLERAGLLSGGRGHGRKSREQRQDAPAHGGPPPAMDCRKRKCMLERRVIEYRKPTPR